MNLVELPIPNLRDLALSSFWGWTAPQPSGTEDVFSQGASHGIPVVYPRSLRARRADSGLRGVGARHHFRTVLRSLRLLPAVATGSILQESLHPGDERRHQPGGEALRSVPAQT